MESPEAKKHDGFGALVLAGPVAAKEYTSVHGFTVDVPGDWLVMTGREIKDNPDLFNAEKKILAEWMRTCSTR